MATAGLYSPGANEGPAPWSHQLRVMVVEDHQVFAQALHHVLDSQGMIVESGPFPSQVAVIETGRWFRPNVTLLDLHLGPLGSGLDLIGPLKDASSYVVVLTYADDQVLLAKCLEAGAAGLAAKTAPFPALLDVIERTVRTGDGVDLSRRYVLMEALRRHRARRRLLEEPFRALSAREREVLAALTEGQTADQIAATSFVSVATVRSQIQSILKKLVVGSQLSAVVRCHDAGITPDLLRRGFPQF